MTSRLFTKPMTLIHQTGSSVGSDRRPVRAMTEQPVKGAVRQRQFVDETDAGLVSTSELLVYLPATAAARAGDRLIIDGDTYEIPSDPFVAWNHRRGSASHLELRARKATR